MLYTGTEAGKPDFDLARAARATAAATTSQPARVVPIVDAQLLNAIESASDAVLGDATAAPPQSSGLLRRRRDARAHRPCALSGVRVAGIAPELGEARGDRHARVPAAAFPHFRARLARPPGVRAGGRLHQARAPAAPGGGLRRALGGHAGANTSIGCRGDLREQTFDRRTEVLVPGGPRVRRRLVPRRRRPARRARRGDLAPRAPRRPRRRGGAVLGRGGLPSGAARRGNPGGPPRGGG